MKKIAGHLCNTFRNVTFQEELDYELDPLKPWLEIIVSVADVQMAGYRTRARDEKIREIARQKLLYMLHYNHKAWQGDETHAERWRILDDNLETGEP